MELELPHCRWEERAEHHYVTYYIRYYMCIGNDISTSIHSHDIVLSADLLLIYSPIPSRIRIAIANWEDQRTLCK